MLMSSLTGIPLAGLIPFLVPPLDMTLVKVSHQDYFYSIHKRLLTIVDLCAKKRSSDMNET